jgi:hypothetical protein
MPSFLVDHAHGKDGVRVGKRWVCKEGLKHFLELTCRMLTFSDECAKSFTHGDNSCARAFARCWMRVYS